MAPPKKNKGQGPHGGVDHHESSHALPNTLSRNDSMGSENQDESVGVFAASAQALHDRKLLSAEEDKLMMMLDDGLDSPSHAVSAHPLFKSSSIKTPTPGGGGLEAASKWGGGASVMAPPKPTPSQADRSIVAAPAEAPPAPQALTPPQAAPQAAPAPPPAHPPPNAHTTPQVVQTAPTAANGPRLAGTAGVRGNTFVAGQGVQDLDDSGEARNFYDPEESRVRERLRQQIHVIKQQNTLIQEMQFKLHDMQNKSGVGMTPSELQMRSWKGKVQDLETRRMELKREIFEMEQDLEKTTHAIAFHRKERPAGQPAQAIMQPEIRTSYESEAKQAELTQKALLGDIARMKQLCIAHDDQMMRQDTQTARLNVHLAQLKQELNLQIGTLKQQSDLLNDEIGNKEREIEAVRSQVAGTRRLEARAYQNAIKQERGIAIVGQKEQQRDEEAYQKYFEALEHVQKLKADLARVRMGIESKESYTQNTLLTLKTAGMQDGSLLPALLSRERDIDHSQPAIQDISYA